MTPERMTFGIFMAPFHRTGENPTLCLQRDLELISWLDTLGYDEAWIGEHHTAPWEPHPAPDLAANQSLAQAVARQALALTCRKAAPCSAQIPPGVKKILLLAPHHLPPAEPGAGQVTYLAQLLAAHGYRVTELLYRLDAPNPDYPRQAELYAKASDAILFGAWDAHLDAALQIETLRRVQRAKKPVVVLGLHTPFDLEYLREADVYLATFGDTRAQMEAVVGALMGEFEPEGKLPIITTSR